MAKEEFVLRTFDPQQDIPAMVQLRIAIEVGDQLGVDTSETSLRAQFNWPGHDPELDRWVVETAGVDGFIGYAWTFAQSPKRSINHVAVHPAWRRRGIGSRLMAAAIARARIMGTEQVVSGTIAKNRASDPFLRQHGYKPVGNNRFLVAPADTIVDEPVWPAGFTVKSLAELGDIEPIVNASNGCYADMWGHRENTVPLTVSYLQETMARFVDSYDPDGIFVLYAPHDEIAGLCFSRVEKETALRVMDSPGVIPKYRHLGLQRPLVQHCMQRLQPLASGEYQIQTYGDFADAVQIYADLGFVLTPQKHLIEYLLMTV